MNKADHGQAAPAAGEGLEDAGLAGFVDLQPALGHRRHLTEHLREVLLVQLLEWSCLSASALRYPLSHFILPPQLNPRVLARQ